MKDYYDVYLIYTKYWNHVNLNNLIKAIKNTFANRNFKYDLGETFYMIKESTIMRERWNSYAKKYEYAKDVSFDNVLECIEGIIDILEPVGI